MTSSALLHTIEEYASLKREYRAEGVDAVLTQVRQALEKALAQMKGLPVDEALAAREPDAYEQILALRPRGGGEIRVLPEPSVLRDKLLGALLCRFAGCTLGAIVEMWSVERMEAWAKLCGDAFPPEDYWLRAASPDQLRYERSACRAYTRGEMDGVPVDDDVTYTLLGLLIAERFGAHFTTEDVGKAWLDWLPIACTAEDVALRNLKKGVPAAQAADMDNPYCQWIGADIRSDPWAYIAAGWPQKAAAMAYQDAYLSHRRNGVYGAMYVAAAQAAAFCVDSAEEALRAGLLEIPAQCALAEDVLWALETAPKLSDWREGRARVDERFRGMSPVHTNNNMCLMIFGLLLGGRDVTKVLGETVAMGLDNDCTAASAGSIVGALVGAQNIPERWTSPFHGRVYTYLNGFPVLEIADVAERFAKLRLSLA